MVNSKKKGKVGELEAARALESILGVRVRRSVQFCGDAGDADLTTEPDAGLFLEVKRCESLNVFAVVEKATEQAGDRTPLVLWRKNRTKWIAVVPLDQLPQLVTKLAPFVKKT